MAKFTPGLAVGAVSGSTGGITWSRNRYGAYTRVRAVPVSPNTIYQQAIKAYFQAATQAWAALTDAQRQAWRNWALVNPVTDALGAKQALDGHAAYVQINTTLLRGGDSQIDEPPIGAPPTALETITPTFDIGAGDFEVAFTATPLGADDRLWVWAAVLGTGARKYYKNLLKLVQVSAKAQASPLDIESAVETRFGALAVGQTVVLEVQVQDSATGLLSTRLSATGAVVST